jgi:hypothetical protein
MFALQIVIKQWDKAQQTATHISQRANSPDRYPILFPPAFYVLDKLCIIDQHEGDLHGRRIKWNQPVDDIIKFDRFELDLKNKVITHFDEAKPDNTAHFMDLIDKQWVQCKYTHRYSVFEGDFYYWLYEEVTLNAIEIDVFDEHIFIKNEPGFVFNDVNHV